MKLFRRCMNLVEAQHQANILRAAGMRIELRNIYLSGALGDLPFTETGPELWLATGEDETLAASILEEARLAPAGAEWRCERCGERIEGQFAQCWQCGAVRPFAP